jgi:hypothetical protein
MIAKTGKNNNKNPIRFGESRAGVPADANSVCFICAKNSEKLKSMDYISPGLTILDFNKRSSNYSVLQNLPTSQIWQIP